jgi:hypothetical protein
MNIAELANQVKSKEDFIFFLQELQKDLAHNSERWENPQLDNYLEAMEAFLTGSTDRSLVKVDFTPSWSLFANIMLVASMYE